ncbi:type II secretion system minor pseudopilin GspI [Henriciella aquimarina]|uniref:type II secretion system minor pseudopilin GspI n=1 Tax=Henriciella aquimarina TaxID=545261 RepID=UPI0009FC5B43|nr:type II secretion system minor pseudopilin GspI [Henriciella aquimarina]
MRDKRQHKDDQGFSLVETVAALGILSLAAVPLMQLSSGAVQHTARLETHLFARTTAENVLARAMADPEPAVIGQTAGTEEQMGRIYDWMMVTAPTGQDGLLRLEVRVQLADKDQTLARLVTLKADAS